MSWKDKFPKENRYHETENGILYHGDCLELIKNIPEESIDCVVSSPPYFNLRDYGINGQIGLESHFDEYINKLIVLYNEVFKCLKLDGTNWVNLGDTYFGSGKGAGSKSKSKESWRFERKEKKICKQCGKEFEGYLFQHFCSQKCAGVDTKQIDKFGVQSKSLCLVPERFAIKMVKNGWILRNKIIWSKPDTLPEAVKDRFTKSYEFIYFFTKSRKYYFKQQFELANYDGRNKNVKHSVKYKDEKQSNLNQTILKKSTKRWYYKDKNGNYLRNKRDVWNINTGRFKGSHFAVFPNEIPKICIDAGCKLNGIVFDPFMGSGTTAVVAEEMGIKWIGFELNPEYCEMIKKRLKDKKYLNSLF